MNPLEWPIRERVALGIFAAIGLPLGVVIGYVVYALGWGSDALSFGFWIGEPIRYRGAIWALFGAAITAGLFYAIRLVRTAD